MTPVDPSGRRGGRPLTHPRAVSRPARGELPIGARVLAGVAHQLGQPLAVLWDCLDAAVEKAQRGRDCREEMEAALAQCETLTQHVRSLDELAEVELPGKSREPVQLGKLTKQMAEEIAPLAEMRGVRLALETGVNPSVDGDSQRVRQALLHMLGAAIHAGGNGTKVRVSVSREGQEGTVVIATTAEPPSPEEWASLLDPFCRQGGASAKVFQDGMGLAVARRICETLGGSLEPTRTSGCPWALCLRLPLASD
jgi:two-component system OmpR family sensor kinase